MYTILAYTVSQHAMLHYPTDTAEAADPAREEAARGP